MKLNKLAHPNISRALMGDVYNSLNCIPFTVKDLSVVTTVAGITIGSIPAQSNGEIPTSNLSTQECFF